jgi:hypothetical protein
VPVQRLLRRHHERLVDLRERGCRRLAVRAPCAQSGSRISIAPAERLLLFSGSSAGSDVRRACSSNPPLDVARIIELERFELARVERPGFCAGFPSRRHPLKKPGSTRV